MYVTRASTLNRTPSNMLGSCFLFINQSPHYFKITCQSSLRSKCFRRAFRPLEALFVFWLRKNWGERNTDESSGEGEGRREKETLARKPMILKNIPLTLSQFDKFTV